MTALALRRAPNVDAFPQDVQELIAFLRDPAPGQRVKAVPGAGSQVPIWILGSSLYGAQLAAELGLPFAFASHFAPAQLMPALEIYRTLFRKTSIAREPLERPYVMPGHHIVAADSDREARRLFTSHQRCFSRSAVAAWTVRHRSIPDRFDAELTPIERAELEHVFSSALVGSPSTFQRGMTEFRTARPRTRHRFGTDIRPWARLR